MHKAQAHHNPKSVLRQSMSMKRVLVTHNNRKKHGAYPVVHEMAEGCIFSSGQVVLSMPHLLAKGFLSVNEMEAELGEYGDVQVDYVDHDEPEHTVPALSLISRIVLRDLIRNALYKQEVHDLVWFYATQYGNADVEAELKTVINWLETLEDEKSC